MFGALRTWIERRKAIRRRWKHEADLLLGGDERLAYYEAQRFAWRARYRGDDAEFWHWIKVASEVARRSERAEMEMSTVEGIADEERLRASGWR